MLRELLSWWAEQMAGLLPHGLRAWAAQRSSVLLISAIVGADGEPFALDLAIRRNRRERQLGQFPLGPDGAAALRASLARNKPPANSILRLGPGMLLEREVALPMAAEQEAPRVLAYEIDRLTPFTAAELVWGWAILRRDRAQGRIHLRLSLVPRAQLQRFLETLEAARVRPRALAGVAPSGIERVIPLDRPGRSASRISRAAPALAAGTCVVLGAVAILLPFARQAIASSEIEQRIAALRPQVAEVEALRNRIAGDRAGADVIAAERARLGDPLQVIAVVTDVLPDDTHLTELQLRRGRLGIAGQSAAAARLIPALAAEPTLRNPAFVAPVTRVENGQADLFSIAAELGPER